MVPKCLNVEKAEVSREVERQFTKPKENAYEKDYIFDKNCMINNYMSLKDDIINGITNPRLY